MSALLEGCDRLDRALAEGTLARKAWRGTDAQGREIDHTVKVLRHPFGTPIEVPHR